MIPQVSPFVDGLSGPFLKRNGNKINDVEGGLQIRVDRFDSGTRLQYLADLAENLSTSLSTFAVHPLFVLGASFGLFPARPDQITGGRNG